MAYDDDAVTESYLSDELEEFADRLVVRIGTLMLLQGLFIVIAVGFIL